MWIFSYYFTFNAINKHQIFIIYCICYSVENTVYPDFIVGFKSVNKWYVFSIEQKCGRADVVGEKILVVSGIIISLTAGGLVAWWMSR